MILAALASLSLGAVIGPEAPLIALGGGLALLAADRTKLGANPRAGRPDRRGRVGGGDRHHPRQPAGRRHPDARGRRLASRSVMLVIVPCIVSSGVGALLFTGLGHWTGLPTGSLALPDISATTLDAATCARDPPGCGRGGAHARRVVLGRRVAAAPRRPVPSSSRSPPVC